MLLESVAQYVIPQPAVLQQLGQMGCFPSKASQSRPETWRATGTISLRDAKLKVHLLSGCAQERTKVLVSSTCEESAVAPRCCCEVPGSLDTCKVGSVQPCLQTLSSRYGASEPVKWTPRQVSVVQEVASV